MAIRTISDLKSATPAQVKKALERVAIDDDLYSFMKWVNDTGFEFSVPLDLGNPPRSLGVHPSSVSKVGACPLKIYWECTGAVEKREKFEKPRQDTFDIGTAKHIMMQTMLELMFRDQFSKEVKLRNEALHIKSSADGLFDFPDLRFILEIKTIKEGGSYGFEKVQAKPLPDHVRQLTMYMHLSDVPFGLVYYWCKNTSQVKEHPLVYDPKVWMELENLIIPIVEAAYNDGPEVLPKPSYACKWCGFWHGCDAGRSKNEGPTTRTFRRR